MSNGKPRIDFRRVRTVFPVLANDADFGIEDITDRLQGVEKLKWLLGMVKRESIPNRS